MADLDGISLPDHYCFPMSFAMGAKAQQGNNLTWKGLFKTAPWKLKPIIVEGSAVHCQVQKGRGLYSGQCLKSALRCLWSDFDKRRKQQRLLSWDFLFQQKTAVLFVGVLLSAGGLLFGMEHNTLEWGRRYITDS